MNSESDIVHCPHALQCQGCALIGAGYEAQLAAKQSAVERALKRFPDLQHTQIASIRGAAPVVAYRERAKLVVGASGEVGLYARGSHDVVDIPECRVLSPELSRVAETVRAQMPRDLGISALDLRRVDAGVMLTLIADQHSDVTRLRAFAERLRSASAEIVSIAASFRAPGAVQLLGSDNELLFGSSTERHHLVVDQPFHYAAHGAFTQVHASQTAALHELIQREIAALAISNPHVLELYAGSGSLALRLARSGARVVMVEAFAPAVERALQAASQQNLTLQAIAGDAAGELDRLLRARERAQFDLAIVNPPRRGVTPEVRSRIAELKPALVLYVSCNPLTLARDLSHFSQLGYRSKQVTPFDMIPLTDAVEALAVLRRASAPEPELVYEDETLIAVVKPAYESVMPDSAAQSSLLERVRRLPRAAQAVAAQRLDFGTSGVCLFAREARYASDLKQALAAAPHTYVALAKGIVREKGSIKRPLYERGRAQAAETRYVRQRVVGGHSLVRITLTELRPQQIQKHLAGIGHPVLGDKRHGDTRSNLHFEHRHGLDRPFLHCERVVLTHAGQSLELAAALRPELDNVLESLSEEPTLGRKQNGGNVHSM